jgi:hypothetical protein
MSEDAVTRVKESTLQMMTSSIKAEVSDLLLYRSLVDGFSKCYGVLQSVSFSGMDIESCRTVATKSIYYTRNITHIGSRAYEGRWL